MLYSLVYHRASQTLRMSFGGRTGERSLLIRGLLVPGYSHPSLMFGFPHHSKNSILQFLRWFICITDSPEHLSFRTRTKSMLSGDKNLAQDVTGNVATRLVLFLITPSFLKFFFFFFVNFLCNIGLIEIL